MMLTLIEEENYVIAERIFRRDIGKPHLEERERQHH